MSDYKLDTSTPGILKSSINTFVKFHGVREYVKLSIDGKKLSYGIGKLGEEDLGGHAKSPTLQQRQSRIENEVQTVQDMYDAIDMDATHISELLTIIRY